MIKECEACHIDFETDHDGKRFCRVRSCIKDRHADIAERSKLKLIAARPYERGSYFGDNFKARGANPGRGPRKHGE